MRTKATTARGNKERGTKTIAVALVLAVLLLGVSLAGMGDSFSVSSSGTWQNWSPAWSCISVQSHEIRWGNYGSDGDCISWSQQSGFTFTGQSVTLPENAWTTIAQFTHRNYVIYGGYPTDLELRMTLSGDISNTYVYDIDFEETPNSGDNCCDDIVTFVTSPGTHTFVKDGRTYTFDLAFSGAASTIYTSEDASTTVDLQALVTCIDADLRLEKSADDTTPNVGSNVTFTLTVTNDGPQDTSSVTVEDVLPSGLAYVSHSGGTYSSTTGIWDIGSLGNGDSETLYITATVLASGDYDNYAQVESSSETDPDSDPGDDSTGDDDDATVDLTPVPIIDLSVDKCVDDNTPNVART